MHEGDPILAELWPFGGRPRRLSSGDGLKPSKPRITSFSTGPKSVPTHWKQTLFLLREPIKATEGTSTSYFSTLSSEHYSSLTFQGTVVQGVFKLRKSSSNTRELDVEIHYAVRDASSAELGEAVIQTFKVR